MPELLNSALQEAVKALEEASRSGILPTKQEKIKNSDMLPLRVSRESLINTDKS